MRSIKYIHACLNPPSVLIAVACTWMNLVCYEWAQIQRLGPLQAFIWTTFCIDEPMLQHLGPSQIKSKALQVLRVKDHQRQLQGHKLQKLKPTSPQASKDKFTSFKWSSPQASMLQSHKLQRFKPTTLKLEGFKAQIQSPPSSGPQQQASRT